MQNVKIRTRFNPDVAARMKGVPPGGLTPQELVAWHVKGCAGCRPIVVSTRPATASEQKQLEVPTNNAKPTPIP